MPLMSQGKKISRDSFIPRVALYGEFEVVVPRVFTKAPSHIGSRHMASILLATKELFELALQSGTKSSRSMRQRNEPAFEVAGSVRFFSWAGSPFLRYGCTDVLGSADTLQRDFNTGTSGLIGFNK